MRKIYFLGKSLIGAGLPHNWTAIMPKDMEEHVLVEIFENEGIIVIGTVKKIDDLRRRCKEFGLELRFGDLLHDEFVRQTWLDFFTIAKVADNPCGYHALEDRMQTKVTISTDIYQQPDETCQKSMKNYRVALTIQKDMWKSYDDFVDFKSKQPGGKLLVKNNLKTSMELPKKLHQNRRSHPDIVIKCSNAFYNSEMKPARDEDNSLDRAIKLPLETTSTPCRFRPLGFIRAANTKQYRCLA